MIKTDSDIQEHISVSHFQKLQIFILFISTEVVRNCSMRILSKTWKFITFYFHFNADPLCRKTNLTCHHEILKVERQIKELSFKVSLFAERTLTCVNITIY